MIRIIFSHINFIDIYIFNNSVRSERSTWSTLNIDMPKYVPSSRPKHAQVWQT